MIITNQLDTNMQSSRNLSCVCVCLCVHCAAQTKAFSIIFSVYVRHNENKHVSAKDSNRESDMQNGFRLCDN